jgi:hypothetical protein
VSIRYSAPGLLTGLALCLLSAGLATLGWVAARGRAAGEEGGRRA